MVTKSGGTRRAGGFKCHDSRRSSPELHLIQRQQSTSQADMKGGPITALINSKLNPRVTMLRGHSNVTNETSRTSQLFRVWKRALARSWRLLFKEISLIVISVIKTSWRCRTHFWKYYLLDNGYMPVFMLLGNVSFINENKFRNWHGLVFFWQNVHWCET